MNSHRNNAYRAWLHASCFFFSFICCGTLANLFTLYRILEFANRRGILINWPHANTFFIPFQVEKLFSQLHDTFSKFVQYT